MLENSLCQWGMYRVMRYIPGDMTEMRRTFTELRADGISLAAKDVGAVSSLDFLQEFGSVKIVLLRGLAETPLDGLKKLSDLEEVSIDETKLGLDLSIHPSLKRVTADWGKSLFKNTQMSGLKSLRLSKYKSRCNDLSDFPVFPELRELELVQSTIQSLNGISNNLKLNRVEFHHLTKLESLAGLDLPELKVFIADVCKKMSAHSSLGLCVNLEELKLHECGVIESLDFVKHLRKLKSFRFIKTDVLDGDLSPLLSIDDVFFTEKRHFSHKVTDMKQSQK